MAQNKKLYISILSVICSLSVVLLHMSGFWSFKAPANLGWIFSNLIESVCYFAVPVFFMISGATLIDFNKRYTLKEYFKKRFSKTAIPFIFWSIFGLVFIIIRTNSVPSGLTIASFINSIMNCGYTGIYWFFPALFSIYLAIPVFSAINENVRQKTFAYIIIIGTLFNSVLPFIFSFTNGKINFNRAINLPVASGYILFAIIGYYIDKYEIKKTIRYIIYALGLLGLLVHFFGTWYLSNKSGNIDQFFKGYTGVPSILYSAAIFIFCKYFDFNKLPSTLIKVLTYFKGQTFGIHLIHIYLIQIVSKYITFNFRGYIYLYRTIGAIIIFILCGFITKLMQKIPLVKRIIP